MMRVFILTIVITLPMVLFGQQHFSWTKYTGNNATIAVLLSTEISVNGSSLQPGDEIGVFTPGGLCVGGIVWNADKNEPLTVWGNNEMTPVKDGIDVGEIIHFRVWLAHENIEYEIVAIEYESGDGIYKVNGLYVLRSLTAVPKPDMPGLFNPEDNATIIGSRVSFEWNTSSWAGLYQFQIASDSSFESIVTERELLQTEIVVTLDFGATYYWRVRAVNIAGMSEWSDIRRFKTGTELHTMQISLHSGWNMISSNVHPDITDIATLFEEVDDPHLFIKNNAGYSYWPSLDIFNLVEFNVYEGYQVFVSGEHTFSIYGTNIDPESTSIGLLEGWNIIPYFPVTLIPISEALESIKEYILVVKDIYGNIYWPEYDVNTMGNMQPGQGYQLFLSADAELIYPASMQKLNSSNEVSRSIRDTNIQTSRYTPNYTNTGSNAVILIQCPDMKDGDEIGVWMSSGQLVGSGVVIKGRAIITVWGNNMATPDMVDGAVEDEELSLTYWSNEKDEEQEIIIKNILNVLDPNRPVERLNFTVNGLYVISIRLPDQEGHEMVPQRYSLGQNFPNPFNPSTQIQFSIPNEEHVRITVYSLIGQKVSLLLDEQRSPGIYTVDFNASNLPSGLYFYRLDAGSYHETKKMMLAR
jgi:hypothetical protein